MGIIKAVNLIFDYIRHDEEEDKDEVSHALKGVSLDIKEGDFVAILGHNGSGKSTFAKLMNGILLPTDGTVYISKMRTDDEEHLWDVRKTAGMVFQNPDNQIIGNVVEEDVGFGPENMGVPTEEIWARVDKSLEAVGMTAYRLQSPNKLSGGQKQRVAMARMLAAEPELILLDEPFSALDTYLKWQLEQEMYKHLKEAGKPVIFVSHNRDEVYRLCDTVSCMNRGKMEVMEPLKEFFQNPKTRTAAILSGCKNISAAERVDAHTLRAVDWGVTLHVKEREIADDIRAVGIRAHFLATVERPGEENVFPVNESEIWEDPFEWNISFRKNAECSWLQWKIAKTDWSPEMGIPKELYLKEEDILLLTDS